MASDDNNYVPRSPDLTARFDAYEPQPLHPQHQTYRGSLSNASPFTPTGATDSYFGRGPGVGGAFGTRSAGRDNNMVRAETYDDEEYGAKKGRTRGRGKKSIKAEDDTMELDDHYAGSSSGAGGMLEVKTKFPVARIKRIMQADEDVGKVAQVTPVAVAKALELFMISLVTKAATEAKARSSKRVVATDLKQAVLKDVQFDFLNEIVGKIADAPTSNQKLAGGGDGDSDDGGEKKRRGGRRKKKDADEF